jgi:hypothetical protein
MEISKYIMDGDISKDSVIIAINKLKQEQLQINEERIISNKNRFEKIIATKHRFDEEYKNYLELLKNAKDNFEKVSIERPVK